MYIFVYAYYDNNKVYQEVEYTGKLEQMINYFAKNWLSIHLEDNWQEKIRQLEIYNSYQIPGATGKIIIRVA